MNNVMFGAMMVSIWEILVALLVLLVMAGVVAGAIVLVVWLMRRGKSAPPVAPPIRQQEHIGAGAGETRRFSFAEIRAGQAHVRWVPYGLGLVAVILGSGALNGLLLAAGVWSGVDTVLFGTLAGVVAFNLYVIYQFNRLGRSGEENSIASRNAPRSEPMQSTSSPTRRKGRKFTFVEEHGGEVRVRWGVCCLSAFGGVLAAALAIELFLALGGWKSERTLLTAIFCGVGSVCGWVIYEWSQARKAQGTRSTGASAAGTEDARHPGPLPRGEGESSAARGVVARSGAEQAPGSCPRCGAALPAEAPQGLCPRCVLGVGLATQTEATGESGPHGTKVVQAPPEPAEIAKHFPQLEILDCLGRGGMGVVYKARQPKLNRLVALKILAPEKGADPKFAERFLREAQALARLNHPNIVTVHDFGEAEGLYYLLMEYVDGMTLRQLLQGQKLAPEEALSIVPKICEALQFAHELGVVHRDIKPENVLVDRQGRVKIADFGIAKIVAADQPRQAITQDQVIGTPHYMAPEQVEKPQLVDHRADIYSLGVVFYEMLTGELPLGKFQPPSKKVQVDVRLDEVVLHALEKEPERRYQHASEVKTAVETIAATPGVPAVAAPPADASEVTPAMIGQYRRHLWVKAGCFFFAAVCFLIAAVSYTVSDNTLAALLSAVATVCFGIAAYRHFAAGQQVGAGAGSGGGSPPQQGVAGGAGGEPVRILRWRDAWIWNWEYIQLFLIVPLVVVGLALPVLVPRMGLKALWLIAAELGGIAFAITYAIVGRQVRRARAEVPRTERDVAECLMFRRPFQSPGVAVMHEDRLELIPIVGSPISVPLADIVAIKEVRWFNGTRLFFKKGFVMDLATGQRVGVAVAEVYARRWRAKLSRGTLPEIPAGSGRDQSLLTSAATKGWVTAARWTARVLGTLLLAIYGLFVFGEGFPPIGSQPEGVQLSFVGVGLMLLGLALGWKLEGAAALLIASGWTVFRISEGGFGLGAFETPLVAGALYGLCWWATRGRRTHIALAAVAALVMALTLGQLICPTSVFVRGVIIDAETTKPIAGAELTLEGSPVKRGEAGPRPNARSRKDGRFDLYVGWYAERKQVSITAPGYETLTASLGPRALGQRKVSRDYQLSRAGAARGTGLGPVVERVLYSVATQRPIKGEDLDSGREIELSAQVAENSEKEFFYWLAAAGADLLALAREQSWDLWASPKLVGVPQAMWDKASGEELLKALRSGVIGLGRASLGVKEGFAGYQVNENIVFPRTFAFQTQAGALGVLQLTGFAESPRGLRIRYKLAQSGARAGMGSGGEVAQALRKYVRLVVAKDAMTFEGQPTSWETVGALLERVPDRRNTVLECAVTSDQITVQQQNEWFSKCSGLAREHGFAYASFVGVHALGSRGTGGAAAGHVTGAPARFGPVIERVVNDDSVQRDLAIDFDSGKLFSPPPGLTPADTNAFLAWVRGNGIDAIGETSQSIRGLAGLEMVARPVNAELWKALTPRAALTDDVLKHGTPGSPVFLSAKGALPETYLFRTREGGIGLVQITGFSGEPRGVEIRYKLVESGGLSESPPADREGDFVAEHRAELGQKALDAAREFVEEHRWKMRSEFGDQGRVVLRATDAAGKQIMFEEAAMADGTARFTIIAEPGAELSAQRIGAAIWQRLGWVHQSPGVAAQRTPPPLARAEAGTYQVTLTNGITVEVVAVTRNPLMAGLWWKPDGTVLPKPPGEVGEFIPAGMWTRKSVGSNDCAILVRHGGRLPSKWQGGRQYTPRGEFIGHFGVKGVGMAEVIRFPAGTKEAAMHVATAADRPWEAVAVFDGSRTRVLIEGIQVLCTHLRHDADGRCLDVSHNVDRGQYALRMMARFKSGKREEVGLHSGVLSAQETQGYVFLDPSEPDLRAGDIAEFVLERTPWVSGEIGGIALAPRLGTTLRPPEFGPAIERELGGWPSLDCTVLDLDQGRLMLVPTNVVAASGNNPRPMLNWMVQHGADLTVTVGAGAGLHLDDGVLLRLEGGATFESVAASTVRRQLLGGGGAQNVSIPSAEVKAQPVFVYRTREGGMGVLQVLGPSQDPRSLRIRFKAALPVQ